MRRLTYLLIVAATASAVALVGCNSGQHPPKPVAPIPVDLVESGFDAIDVAVKERKGSVVLIDFWATWCPPCREKFPHVVELHKKYADKGLACMSVSLDNDGPAGRTPKEKVLGFLKEQDATFPNFLVADYKADGERLGRRFGFEANLPFQVLLDKAGNRVWDSETKEPNSSELDRLIQEQLAK